MGVPAPPVSAVTPRGMHVSINPWVAVRTQGGRRSRCCCAAGGCVSSSGLQAGGAGAVSGFDAAADAEAPPWGGSSGARSSPLQSGAVHKCSSGGASWNGRVTVVVDAVPHVQQDGSLPAAPWQPTQMLSVQLPHRTHLQSHRPGGGGVRFADGPA